MAEHNITLAYSTDDDGIYVVCSCGWSERIGFNATPDYALSVANQHREEVKTQDHITMWQITVDIPTGVYVRFHTLIECGAEEVATGVYRISDSWYTSTTVIDWISHNRQRGCRIECRKLKDS